MDIYKKGRVLKKRKQIPTIKSSGFNGDDGKGRDGGKSNRVQES